MPTRSRDSDSGITNLPTLEKGSDPARVLTFLAQHRDHHTPAEISTGVGFPRERVEESLRRLKAVDLVTRKGEYWVIEADDRVGIYIGMLISQSIAEDRWKDEGWWLENAVDPREERDNR